MELIESIADPLNIHWAWRKYNKYLQHESIWFDEIELAEFDSNLEEQIDKLSSEFISCTYKPFPIKPIALPKQQKKDGEEQVRQSFKIRIKDQIAWLAYLNIVGPWLDFNMQKWSYGHRLFRPAWFDQKGERQELMIGPYRNTSGYVYRKFNHSWPLFRRHVLLTIRAMNKRSKKIIEITERDKWILEADKKNKIIYLHDNFWIKYTEKTFYAAIDIRKFYPSLHTESIYKIIINNVPDKTNNFKIITKSLLDYELDFSGWSNEELELIELDPNNTKYTGVPTGLVAAGFLSNVAMVNIDEIIAKETINKQIAHFRYVDDHIILAQEYNSLKDWVIYYRDLLKKELNLELNIDKCTPKSLIDDINNIEEESLEKATQECMLDPTDPAPLLTQTIAKISQLAAIDFDLLDDQEQATILQDLEHLMLADFPDTEIPAATRISFASTLLSRLAAKKLPSILEIAYIRRNIFKLMKEQKELKKLIKDNEEIKLLKVLLSEKEKYRENIITNTRKKYFDLLLRAIHKHPDKIKLWKRIFDYSLNSGYSRLTPIRDELNYLNNRNELPISYIRAYLYQIVSKQVLNIINMFSISDIEELRLHELENYLFAITKGNWLPNTKYKMQYYEEISKNNYIFSLSVLRFYLINQIKNNKLKRTKQIIRNIEKIQYISFELLNDKLIYGDLCYQIWWAERCIESYFPDNPSKLWRTVTNLIDSKEITNQFLYQLYPRHIKDIDAINLLQSEINHIYKYEGWIYELIKYNDKAYNKIKKDKGLSEKINIAKYSLVYDDKHISLDKWCDWTNKQFENNPNDPRVSEWTSLKIIQKIIKYFISIESHIENIEEFLHPSNFLLDRKFTDEPDEPFVEYSWETWKIKIEPLNIDLRDKNSENQIRDWRFKPKWTDKQKIAFIRDWMFMPGISILLSGLLLRNYDFPPLWNIHGHEPAWFGITRKILERMNCSSWTFAIIESCLSPRSWDNFTIAERQPPANFDYEEGTPDNISITEPKELLHFINIALKVLERGQMSLVNHKPRQLVPLILEQITDNTEVEEIHEDDTDIG